MESKYLLEIDDRSYGWRGFDDSGRAEQAAKRLYHKCVDKRPFVAVHIKNPRYSGS